MLKLMLKGVCAAAVLCCGTLAAQDTLAELYGRGVHAFNSHRYTDAYDYLSLAVEQNTPDPRVYYFRGITLERLGRPQEAADDFAKAARLEAEGNGRYNVGMALQRVQGSERVEIETARVEARLDVLRNGKSQVETRGDQLAARDAEVLRGSNDPPKNLPETDRQDATDPFGGDTAPAPVPAPTPDTTPAPAGGDPFGSDPTPDTTPAPAGGDPFGSDPTPDTTPAPAGGDPFGGATAEAPAGGDPFGAPATPEAPAGPDTAPTAPAVAAPSGPIATNYIPAGYDVAVVVNLSRMLNSPIGKKIMSRPEVEQGIEAEGDALSKAMKPQDVQRAIALIKTPQGPAPPPEPAGIIRLAAGVSTADIMKAIEPEATGEGTHAGQTYKLNADGSAIVAVDDTTLLIGPEDDVKAMLDAAGPQSHPLAQRLGSAANDRDVTAVVMLESSNPMIGAMVQQSAAGAPPQAQPFLELADKFKVVELNFDLQHAQLLRLRMEAMDDASKRKLQQLGGQLIGMAKLGWQTASGNVKDPTTKALLDGIVNSLAMTENDGLVDLTVAHPDGLETAIDDLINSGMEMAGSLPMGPGMPGGPGVPGGPGIPGAPGPGAPGPGGPGVMPGDAGNDPFGDDPPMAPGDDPFGGGAAPAPGGDPFGGGAAPAPGAPAPAPGGDPFGGGAAPAPGAPAPAPGGDPFGGGAAPAPGAPAPAPGGDPFGGGAAPAPGAPAPAPGGDPFGGGAAPAPGAPAPAPGGDPFGGGAAPAPGAPAPAPGGDPFGGGAAPAPGAPAPAPGGDPFGGGAAPAPGAPAPAPGGDPFGGGAAPAPGAPAPAPGGDPFGGGAAPAPGAPAPAPGGDPFGGGAAPAPGAPAPAPGGDPFGGGAAPAPGAPAPAPGGDPFGGGAAPAPGEPAPAPGGDPFGGAAPAPGGPAAAPGADPFGAAPAPPAGADPFAN